MKCQSFSSKNNLNDTSVPLTHHYKKCSHVDDNGINW